MKSKVKAALSVSLCTLLLLPFILWPYGMNVADVKALAPAEVLLVNFQPPDQPVPDGYVPDHGATYRHQNGHTYGWNQDLTAHTVTSNTYGDPSEDPLQTFIRTNDSVWEVELEDGLYDVSVSVGDAVYSSVNTVSVEGIVFFDQTELAPGQHATVQHTVSVGNGKLTVVTEQSVLNSIIIKRSYPALMAKSSSSVVIEPPPERKHQSGNHVLLSGQANPSHNAPPHLNIDGLFDAIHNYLTEQIQQLKQSAEDISELAISCSGCSVADIQQLADQSGDVPVVIRTGHLNLDGNLSLGSEDRPVVLIVDGINTNQPLEIEIYGSLIVNGNLNANSSLSVLIHSPSETGSPMDGILSVDGTFHTNDDAIIDVDGSFYAQRYTNNSGKLNMQVGRLLVEDQIHLNSQSEIHAHEEIIVAKLVANNGPSNLNVSKGDFLISDSVHINSEVQINTGGWLAVGGNMTVNQAPHIYTGVGTDGQTILKYTLNGLLAEYFSENDLTGDTYVTVDDHIQLQNNPSLPQSEIADGNFSVRWTGVIVPEYTETYQFHTETKGSVRLWVDDQLLIDAWNGQSNVEQAEIDLQAGQHFNIRMEYAKASSNAQAQLYWESNSLPKQIVPKIHLYPFHIPSELDTTASEHSLTLYWSPISNAESYEVEVNGKIVPIGNHPEYVHEHLLSGTEHRYRVRAIHGDVVGRWSPVLYSWTLPAVPEGIELSSTSDSIRLAWDQVRGATSYEVEINNSVTNIGNVTEYVMHDMNPNVQRAFRVRAVNTSGPGQWSELLVKSTRVGVPKNLRGEPTDTSIDLRWDPVSGADYYDLLVDGHLVEGLTTASYVHDHILPGTRHEYKVRARNEHGEGEWSELVEIVTLLPVPVPEITSVSDTEIVLSWNPVTGAATYEVEVNGTPINIGNHTMYTHSDLEPNSEHSYRVRAINDITFSHWSEAVKAMNKPKQPQNVKTNPGQRSMTVSWDPVTGATGYEVEADGVVVHVGLRTSFVHEPLSPNTVHTYRVRAENAGGKGNWSPLVTDTTLFGTPELTVSKQTATSISLTWEALEGASGYELMADGIVIPIGTQTDYVHLDLEPYTFHVYRLKANGENRDGEWSEALVVPTRLGTVSRIQTNSSSSSITLQWEEVKGAEFYQIEVDGNVVETTVPEYRHTGLSTNSTHAYRVRAVNEHVTGAWSDIIKETTNPAVPEPEIASFTADSITLRWDPVSGASSYDVEVDGRITHNTYDEMYTDTGLEPNTMYRYRVRARGSGGAGQWSEELAQSTSPKLMVNPGQDNIFNFVAIAPKEAGVTTRIITVTYDLDHVEVLDLNAMTPDKVLTTGPVKGTDVTVMEYTPGTIVYRIEKADKTVALSIQLLAKTNEFSEITYSIE